MSVHTRSQKLAQVAFPRVQLRIPSDTNELNKTQKEYRSFAKKFPALIHTCGLAQAVAFALAKKQTNYLADLTEVLKAADHAELTEQVSLDHLARTSPMSAYLRLSRDAINAASWLKRYVEAVAPEDSEVAS